MLNSNRSHPNIAKGNHGNSSAKTGAVGELEGRHGVGPCLCMSSDYSSSRIVKAISAKAQVIHSFSSHRFQNQLAAPSSGTSSIPIFPGVLVPLTINLGHLPSTLWFISLVLPRRAWRVLFWLRSCNSGCADVSSLLALVRSLQACSNTSRSRRRRRAIRSSACCRGLPCSFLFSSFSFFSDLVDFFTNINHKVAFSSSLPSPS